MSKISLGTLLSSFGSVPRLNTNFQSIEDELNDKVLYRDNPGGEANEMRNDLDMNSNDVLNASTIDTQSLTIGGQNVTASAVVFDTPDVIQFNTGATPPAHGKGQLFWDDTADTLSYHNSESDVTVNLGQEVLHKAKNISGVTISDAKVVYVSGGSGGLNTVALARSNARATSQTIGLATHDIENNTDGFVTVFGVVNNVDTSSWSAGDALYVDPTTPGDLTSTKPTSPNYPVLVGYVRVSDAATGSIFVHPQQPIDSTDVADFNAAVIEAIYPVGSIYLSTVATNPGTVFGVGTWAQTARGRTIIGEGTSDQAFTAAATGGASTHVLTSAEMPAHTHSISGDEGTWTISSTGDLRVDGSGGATRNTNSTGSGNAHNNLPPYLVTYVWERTA
jgi:hypothetical protein